MKLPCCVCMRIKSFGLCIMPARLVITQVDKFYNSPLNKSGYSFQNTFSNISCMFLNQIDFSNLNSNCSNLVDKVVKFRWNASKYVYIVLLHLHMYYARNAAEMLIEPNRKNGSYLSTVFSNFSCMFLNPNNSFEFKF